MTLITQPSEMLTASFLACILKSQTTWPCSFFLSTGNDWKAQLWQRRLYRAIKGRVTVQLSGFNRQGNVQVLGNGPERIGNSYYQTYSCEGNVCMSLFLGRPSKCFLIWSIAWTKRFAIYWRPDLWHPSQMIQSHTEFQVPEKAILNTKMGIILDACKPLAWGPVTIIFVLAG